MFWAARALAVIAAIAVLIAARDLGSPPTQSGSWVPASFSRLIASTRPESHPQSSPDGKYIAYQSDRSGEEEIWIAKSDGSASHQLTHLHAIISGYPRWSPDGRHTVFHSRPAGYANLYIADVQTEDYRQLTMGTGNDCAASWSHDSRWIYFESDREDGTQIWRMPSEGGPASRVTRNSGAVAWDSYDGELVFFSKPSEPGLWMLPAKGGVETRILPSLFGLDTFTTTCSGIYFVRRGPDRDAIVSFLKLPGNGVVQDLVHIGQFFESGLSVAPDERSILYAQTDQAGSDLYLVEHFK